VIDDVLAEARTSTYDFSATASPEDPLRALFDDWLPYYRLKWAIARVLQPASILEIGVRFGYSAAAFLDAAPGARYLGIDADVSDYGGVPGALQFAEKLLAPYAAEIVVADSQRYERFPGGAYDLVHVDGQQDGDGSFHDLELAIEQSRYVLVDGYHWSRVNCLAVTEFLHQNLDALDWYFVVPGYAGELLMKVRSDDGPRHASESGELVGAYTSSYYLNDCAGFEGFARHGGARVDDPRLQAVAGIAGITRPRRVLDIGCGRGELAISFARAGAEVVAVDYSRAAIELATRAVADANLAPGAVTLHCGDIATVPLEGRFDVAVASDLIEHLAPAELDVLYDRVKSHLAGSGRLVIHTSPNRWFYEHEYPRRRAQAAALGAYLPPDPRSRAERLMHINEQDPDRLGGQLRRHFASAVVWAGNLEDVRATLTGGDSSTRMRSEPDLFAVASDDAVDRGDLARAVGMDPMAPETSERLRLSVESAPRSVVVGGAFEVGVRLENGSDVVVNSNFPNPVQLAYHWLRGDQVVVDDSPRTRLFPWSTPGSAITLPVAVVAPPAPGRYVLRVVAVQEFIRWFDEPGNPLADDVTVDVTA
jgi:cyclopropane fatty-acyl-phospholipid synthase-like methyltransferase